MSAPEIVVFGSLTIDNVIRASGEVMPQYFGGNALYAALGARIWSPSVGVVSLYGTGYPEAFFDLMADLAIDTAGVHHVGGPHLMNVAFAYQADGSRTRNIPRPLLDKLGKADRKRFYDSSLRNRGPMILEAFGPDGSHMPEAWWGTARAIHCASIPMVRQVDIAEAARRRGRQALRLQCDAPWNDTPASKDQDASALMRLVDVLLPSEQDFENYHPGVSHDDVAAELLGQGLPALVLKRGRNGCRIYLREGGVTDVPVVPVDAIDPTGAGDSFCGGFLAGLQRTADLVAAAHYGAVSASFCVKARGLEGLVAVDPLQAEERLRRLAECTGTQL